eukprot:IDg9138t1
MKQKQFRSSYLQRVTIALLKLPTIRTDTVALAAGTERPKTTDIHCSSLSSLDPTLSAPAVARFVQALSLIISSVPSRTAGGNQRILLARRHRRRSARPRHYLRLNITPATAVSCTKDRWVKEPTSHFLLIFCVARRTLKPLPTLAERAHIKSMHSSDEYTKLTSAIPACAVQVADAAWKANVMELALNIEQLLTCWCA